MSIGLKNLKINGISYHEFRNQLKPNYFKVYLDISLGYLAIIIILLFQSFIFLIIKPGIILSVLITLFSSALIGLSVSYLILFFHEASHYNIHSRKSINDLIANFVIGWLIAHDIKNYRPIHFGHHRYLGTTFDPERSYFSPLNINFIIESLFLIRVIKVLMTKKNYQKNKSTFKSKINLVLLFYSFILHFLILSIFIISELYFVAISWILGMLIFYPFFNALRQLLEHRSPNASSSNNYFIEDHGEFTRMFKGFLKNILGGAGFNKHLLHHWDMTISYTNLEQFEEYLLQDEEIKQKIINSYDTYIGAFKKLYGK